MMTIEEMRRKVDKYCASFGLHTCKGCQFCGPDNSCGWYHDNDESTEDCYWFLVNEGLISKPEQPEINFVKVERNEEVDRQTTQYNTRHITHMVASSA